MNNSTFASSLRWLFIEFVLASILCSIPILWANVLNEQTLHQGMILAMVFLVPSEIFRQLVPKEIVHKITTIFRK